METVAPKQTERFEIRVTPEQRQVLEQAAWLDESTLSAFMLRVVMERAEEMTDAFRGTVVSPETFDELLAWLDEPPVLDEKLVEGFRQLRKFHDDPGAFLK
ncbi:MAG: DUF1778 domain-containing protein [Actinomycetota bacterium]